MFFLTKKITIVMLPGFCIDCVYITLCSVYFLKTEFPTCRKPINIVYANLRDGGMTLSLEI